MQDPYRFLLTNAIASVVLLVGILIYRYLYPKRQPNFIALLLLLSILACLSLLRPGSFESGDFLVHTYRSIAFYHSLMEGHLLPSWAGDLNATYGYPLFIFNYPLPYYLTSFFHALGFSFISSTKMFLFVCFLVSGLLMYACAKQLLKDRLAAFTAATFYLFAPYHLIDVHFRAGVGEVLIFAVLPLTWLAFRKLWEQRTTLWVLLSSLTIMLAIYTHALISPLIMILLFLYAALLSIRTKTTTPVLLTSASFVIGSLCSLYILLTPFLLSRYTILASSPSPVPSLPAPWELLFAPWGGGFLFQGHHGELSYALGYFHILVAAALTVLVARGRVGGKHKRDVLFWLAVCLVCALLTTSVSTAVWTSVPFLYKLATSSQRLLILIAFGTSMLAGLLCLQLPKRRVLLLVILLFATVFSTFLNWGQRRVLPAVTDQTYLNTLWSATSGVEGHWFAMSKWRRWDDLYFRSLPRRHIEFVQGHGVIQEVSRTSTTHTYVVDTRTQALLRESTMYFPGWHAEVDGRPITTAPDNDGVITLTLPKGLHYLAVRYDDVPAYKKLKLVSLTAVVTVLAAILVLWRQKRPLLT
jgi:6-pyruvoyl-tetrahydropterin synthase-like protein